MRKVYFKKLYRIEPRPLLIVHFVFSPEVEFGNVIRWRRSAGYFATTTIQTSSKFCISTKFISITWSIGTINTELLYFNILKIGHPGANSIKLYDSVNYGFVVTAKFHNLRPFCSKLQRKRFYGKGPWPLYFCFYLFTQTKQFFNKYKWKNVHQVYSAGIRTHEKRHQRHLPLKLYNSFTFLFALTFFFRFNFQLNRSLSFIFWLIFAWENIS